MYTKRNCKVKEELYIQEEEKQYSFKKYYWRGKKKMSKYKEAKDRDLSGVVVPDQAISADGQQPGPSERSLAGLNYNMYHVKSCRKQQ